MRSLLTPPHTVRLADFMYIMQPFHVVTFILLEANRCRTTNACTRLSILKEVVVYAIMALALPATLLFYAEAEQRRDAYSEMLQGRPQQLGAINTPWTMGVQQNVTRLRNDDHDDGDAR